MDPHDALVVDPREGDTAPTYEFGPITRTHIVKYAGASGDFTPIHHDEPLARDAGYPEVFAMGMFGAGVLAHYVGDWLGHSRVRTYGVRFTEQVWPGDTLSCGGEVTRRYDDAGETMVDCDVSVTTEDGEQKISGWATVCLDDPVKLPD